MLFLHIGRFEITLVHTGTDTVNRRGIFAIPDIRKDVYQVDVAHTGFKPGKHSYFYHTSSFKIEVIITAFKVGNSLQRGPLFSLLL